MQNNYSLLVLPTTRAKREIAKGSTGFVQKTLTIKEFEERAIYLEDALFIDETTRLLLLRKASQRVGYEKLNIDKDFLVFLEHAPFFLKFYDELFSENVELDSLLIGDSYAEYDDHITVLKTLLAHYKNELEQNGYADKIFLTERYKINRGFIEEFDSIHIVLDGMLSRFELDLIDKIAEIRSVTIELELNRFDEKLKRDFADFDLDLGYRYQLDLTNKSVIKKEQLDLINPAEIYTVKNRSLQVAGVKEAIYKLVKNGVDPSEIAVILPDENFAPILKSYDYKNSFNLSMGTSFERQKFYLDLIALYNYLAKGDRADKLFFERVAQTNLDLIRFRDLFWSNKEMSQEEKIAVFYDLNSLANDEEKKIADRVFSEIATIVKDENLSLTEILYIYLNALKKESIDDIGGGKITVMGALESRSANFEAVIVVDFNEEFVPVTNIKDMFLNSFVRKMAQLPTRYDRENLQRSLYYKLFSRSKHNVIFCVDNTVSKPSRFLSEIYAGVEPKELKVQEHLLFDNVELNKVEEREIELEIDLTTSLLSATKLNTYIDCKRKFYYKYIKNYRESKEIKEDSESLTVGSILHNALKIVIDSGFSSKEDLINKTINIAKKEANSNKIVFELDLWEKRLDKFAENELIRKRDGATPIYLEKSIRSNYNGINIEGQIDRVDRLEDGFVVLDYKSGNIPDVDIKKLKNFQLVFYYLLLRAEHSGKIAAGFYELDSGTIHYLSDIDEAVKQLDLHLVEYKDKHQVFSKTTHKNSCGYCEYQLLCNGAV